MREARHVNIKREIPDVNKKMSRLCKKTGNESVDLISNSFRHTIQPQLCYEKCQHRVLLTRDVSKGVSGNDQLCVFHMHGEEGSLRRSYERFTVIDTEVYNLEFVGYSHRSPQEIERVCERHLSIAEFSSNLVGCYEWSKNALSILVTPSNVKANHSFEIYTGSLFSYCPMNASTQFVGSLNA